MHLPDRKYPRIRGFDYSEPRLYFVTLCTEGRALLFGEVRGDGVHLSQFGAVVRACWDEIPAHYPDVRTDAVVVMPNHVHGILDLTHRPVGARHASTAPRNARGEPALGTIVGSFKSAVSSRINVLRGTPGTSLWQRGFHEHVIRNDDDLRSIREYIVENPMKWHLDRENPRVWRG